MDVGESSQESGNGFGTPGARALGAALRKNRTLTSLQYDFNGIGLDGLKEVRGALYGNKKLSNLPLPMNDANARAAEHGAISAARMSDAAQTKQRIGMAHRRGDWAGKAREIENIKDQKRAARLANAESAKIQKAMAEMADAAQRNAALDGQKRAAKQADLAGRKGPAAQAKWQAKQTKVLAKLAVKVKKAKTERSTVSGKRIKRAEGATADAEGEARREALRAAMNEGEDHEYGVAASSAHSQTATAQAMQARAREAISDPAKMAELMRASADKERAKRQRLSNLQSGGVGGDDYASAIGREYAQQRSNATGRRTAYDAADYMKRDGGF